MILYQAFPSKSRRMLARIGYFLFATLWAAFCDIPRNFYRTIRPLCPTDPYESLSARTQQAVAKSV